MVLPRLLALAPVAGCAVLAAVLTATGELPAVEGMWALAAVAAAFGPSGWVSPGGWRRRLAEAGLLPVMWALTLAGDPTQRRMLLPPLLLAAAWGAAAAALGRAPAGRGPLLAGALGVAARAAGGLGLGGYPWPTVLVVVLAAAALPAALARRWGPQAGVAAALLGAGLPLAQHPGLLVAVGGATLAALWLPRHGAPLEPLATRWVPLVAATALVAAPLGPWGGMPVGMLFPAAGLGATVAALVGLVFAGAAPPALGGAAWLGVACALGPVQVAPPDLPGLTLTAAAPAASLPAATGGPYVVEVALVNAATLPQATPVVEATVGTTTVWLRAGQETAEWAHRRPDVQGLAAHALPTDPVWRPHGDGRGAMWGVAGRVVAPLPAGAAPRLRRAGDLPPEVEVVVPSAGPSRPTPPRRWTLGAWVGAAAAAVGALQLLAGTWRSPGAALPWVPLAAAAAWGRAPVEPLRLLAERHSVDLCLAALLAAWAPAAAGWLGRGRAFAAAAACLVPFALAAPSLRPPGGDEPYHLIVLRSLVEDGDLVLANNYDLERHPEHAIYVSPLWLHSPLLALLLAPGYAVGGRAGALALLALAGAGVLALMARLAAAVGLARSRTALAGAVVLLSFPLATYATQMWTEVPGALAAAGAAVLLVGVPRWLPAAALGVAATGLKTRLGLVAFGPLAAALLPARQSRHPWGLRALGAGAVAAALGLATLVYGHPLGPIRRFHHLLPTDLRQPVVSLLGLVCDAAGGALFAAPVLVVALVGVGSLWRRAGAPVRGLLLGGLATVLALLPSHEWYGGGSPPMRYLVPALPGVWLALAALLGRPAPARHLVTLALPPTVLTWWVFVSRPHLAFNPGDGGWWLGDALARRFAADTRALFPSFLVPTAAAVWVPVSLLGVALALWWLRRRPLALRRLARLAVPLWLVAAAALVGTLAWRTDTAVEAEAAQVVRRGGEPEPPAGTFSRFLYRNGWRLRGGEGVSVPLRLPSGARVVLVARGSGSATARWEGGSDSGGTFTVPDYHRFTLPPPPGPGRQWLHVDVSDDGVSEFVLDRLEVLRP